jgi:uncharacterized membrane protein
MSKMVEWRKEWPALAMLLITLAVTLWAYPQLPDPMPTHWNARNEVDGWSSRAMGAWLVPATMVGTYLLLLAVPLLDPRRENVLRMAGLYRLLRIGHQPLLRAAPDRHTRGDPFRPRRACRAAGPAGRGVALHPDRQLHAAMKPDWFMGVRTPWTLSSDTVWRKTHWLGASS